MKVMYVGAECAPFFKTGGLGDVLGALPKEIAKKGEEVSVILPFHEQLLPDKYKKQLKDLLTFTVNVGWREQFCGIKKLSRNGVDYYFIDNQYYFGREGIYGYYDDGERYAFFQMAAIEALEKIKFIPDVIHVNDYHTAMIPFLLKEKYHWIKAYQGIKTVLSIHNLQFQGRYAPEILPDLFGMGMEKYHDGTIRFEDDVNFMKAGLIYSDQIVTVSPSYAEEIKTPDFGEGLHAILHQEDWRLRGILNGIDYDIYDPETDENIYENYGVKTIDKKIENKRALQKEMGLPVKDDAMLIGVVSRLTRQKGFQLLLTEMSNLLQFNIQIVVLGTGDPDFEHDFKYFSDTFEDKCHAVIAFNFGLAQKIYAGCDMFLMPSAFEPCGLSQMIAMRYGTVPLIHEIGGLRDSVAPFNQITKKGTGFGFVHFSSYVMMETLKVAIDVYQNEPKTWREIMLQGMKTDFSWKTASRKYQELYRELV